MSRRPNVALRRLVLVTKCAIVGALAFITVVTANTVEDEGVTTGQEVATTAPHQGRLDTLIDRHLCSTTGFGPDVVPRSALVLRGGKVQHVTFDLGWSIYTGKDAGTLLAVCQTAP